MKVIGLEEFVRRLRRLIDQDGMIAFFLGAGASISSGVPGAAELANRWAAELHATEVGDRQPFDQWLQESFPEFDPTNAAAAYALVMRRLFPSQAERQHEIERVVSGKDPGFAYTTLAQLISTPPRGLRCNVVLTTNFDDLVADALYLFTSTRPLVVTHEALVGYAALGRSRPTVIKLHGDAMLEPKNTFDEVETLSPAMLEALQRHLHSRALVFIGYGGNDHGIAKALQALPKDAISHGIYWLSPHVPDNDFGSWLSAHPESVHVEHLDFDELMAVVKDAFDIPNPTDERFSELMDRYHSTFSALQANVQANDDPHSAVARSVEEIGRTFKSWYGVQREAQQYKHTDPKRAQSLYEAGLTQYPESHQLRGNYALFLSQTRMDDDLALATFKIALAASPNTAIKLTNYACFLMKIGGPQKDIRKSHELAVAVDADDPNVVANYAGYLYAIGELDLARELSQRAVSLKDSIYVSDSSRDLELLFYSLSNDPDLSSDERTKLIEDIRTKLDEGQLCHFWDFGMNVERSRELDLPTGFAEFLEALAAVITGFSERSVLDGSEYWPAD